jgi:putative ABC transport system permease protein
MEAELAAQRAVLDQSQAQYQAGLSQYQEGLAQYESGLAQYNQGLAQYNQGWAQYQAGLADYEDGAAQVLALVETGIRLKDAAKEVSDHTGLSKNDLYAAALERRK